MSDDMRASTLSALSTFSSGIGSGLFTLAAVELTVCALLMLVELCDAETTGRATLVVDPFK